MRWFKLVNNRLYYYERKDSTHHISFIPLDSCNRMWRSSKTFPKGKEDCVFAISVIEQKKTRVYVLCAPDKVSPHQIIFLKKFFFL